jgi:fatty-acyl-CoA synthase
MPSVNTLDSLIGSGAERQADRPVLTLEDRDLSYRDLVVSADLLASRLAKDVSPGQRVGIVAPNVPALAIGMLATWRLGGVAIPLSARYREHELRHILGNADLATIVSVEAHGGYSFAELLPTLLPGLPTVRRCFFVDAWGQVTGELAVDAPAGAESADALDPAVAAILYTSGTTGEPKGALVTHRREIEGARTMNDVLGAAAEDRCVFVVPLSHAFGLTCFLAALAAGSRALLVESSFTPAPLLRAIEHGRATILHGSPALFASLLKSTGGHRTTLRTGFVAGAPCPRSVIEELDAAGLTLLNLYGTTETGATACCRTEDPSEARYSTVGRPLPGHELRVVDGEVQVRGSAVTTGYYRRPEQTAAAFDGEWFWTGDLGAIDERGHLSITGRTKEMIQVGGLAVSPAEVEAVLLTHPDVQQVVVVGVPHEAMGEALRAFVVPRPGSSLTTTALLQFARARIAGYKLPYAIELVPTIPTLPSGKPDRRAVNRSVEEGTRAG